MQVRTYRSASKELLEQAMNELAQGDVRQASEKGWGAAAQMVKAVAQQRGWSHNHHALLHQIVDNLAKETGDNELHQLFHTANSLHINFYENWSTPNGVASGIHDIERLVEKLEPLLLQEEG
jgi:hypothetical protein